MENIKLEETGQKSISNQLHEIVKKIDDMAPKVDVINWKIFDAILSNHDFTKCKNTLDVMKKFYECLWTHVIFPHEEEAHLKDRENGRLIIEAHEWRLKACKLEEENISLREELQGIRQESPEEE